MSPNVDTAVAEVQTHLNHLLAENRYIYTQFFDIAAHLSQIKPHAAETDRIQDDFEVFTKLLWKARDIAGDIRAAAIDFRVAVLDVLLDEKVTNDRKEVILSQWSQNLKNKAINAKDLPLDCNKLSYHVKVTYDIYRHENNPHFGSQKANGVNRVLDHIATCLRHMIELLAGSMRKSFGPQKEAKGRQRRPVDTVDQLKHLHEDLGKLANHMLVFTTIYDDISTQVPASLRTVMNAHTNTPKDLDPLVDRLNSYAQVLESYQKTV